MSDKSWSTRINAQGAVTIRQKPKLLLMKIDLEAVAATLELALANIKKQCAAASRWLQGLAANSVEFGEPHFVNPVAITRSLLSRGTLFCPPNLPIDFM